MPTAPCSVDPDPLAGDVDSPEIALSHLAAGGLVAFPTETVWGLAALARRPESLEALLRWKGRGPAHPIAVLVTGPSEVERLGFEPGPVGRSLAAEFWPGPLTLVARPGAHALRLAPGVARDDGAVGFRCSSHPFAAALARAAEARGLSPLTATSLNRSGAPPAGDRGAAHALCRGPGAPLVWPSRGGDALGEAPSTVVDVTGDRPVVLRAGAIAPERIESHGAAAAAPHSEESLDR
ncbi:MAG: L-threonylcarbamoyladenylate synthase [Myxococcota bacterium]